MKRRWIAGVLLLALSACSDPNPLLGEWQLVSSPDTVTRSITFTDSQSISGTTADTVTYAIQDDQVIVTSSLGFKLTYRLVDANTLQVTLPGTGPMTYTRISQ